MPFILDYINGYSQANGCTTRTHPALDYVNGKRRTNLQEHYVLPYTYTFHYAPFHYVMRTGAHIFCTQTYA